MNFGLYYPPFHLEREKTLTAAPRWMEWINGFDLMLNNCYVPEAEKYQLLLRFVGRGVRDIASNMKLEMKAKPDVRYSTAKRSLADHFRKLSSANVTFQRYFFGWLRQRNDEPFNAFHSRVKDVASACNFGPELELRVRDQIVMGCRSDDIRRQAFLGDLSLHEVLQIGRDLRDESDSGLLTSGGDVLSVFLPDSAMSLIRVVAPMTDEAPVSHNQRPPNDPLHQPPMAASGSQRGQNGANPSLQRAPGAYPVDALSQFHDLSLAQDAGNGDGMSAAERRKEKLKEKAKEKRRAQRRETREAIKTKPLEELTEKQRKFYEYQQKIREKWNRRKLEGKKSAATGGEGTENVASDGVADEIDEADDGIKFASDNDNDEEYAGEHLDNGVQPQTAQ